MRNLVLIDMFNHLMTSLRLLLLHLHWDTWFYWECFEIQVALCSLKGCRFPTPGLHRQFRTDRTLMEREDVILILTLNFEGNSRFWMLTESEDLFFGLRFKFWRKRKTWWNYSGFSCGLCGQRGTRVMRGPATFVCMRRGLQFLFA